MDRRRFLGLVGVSAIGGIAGCGGSEASGESVDDHPAAAGIESQPRRGDLGGHVVLTFEDPSCSRCRAFHEQTVPKIQSSLVDAGIGSYVVRTYPVVYPWGKPATQALEATFARDDEAFWALLDHYFTNQGQFDKETVLEQTAAFLDESTDLDGGAVADDARTRAYDEAVQADIDAAKNAGLSETTPIVLLFRDGEFVTKVNGSISYEVIAEALGEAN